MNGEHHFNEVFLDNVFVPDDRVVGEIGQGWKQVTSELALERSGPERYMTTFPLFTELMRRLGGTPDARAAEAAGKLAARMWSLRRMSLAIAITLDPGPDSEQGTPKATVDLATEAALVKDMGTFFEREIIDAARLLATVEPAPDADGFVRALPGRHHRVRAGVDHPRRHDAGIAQPDCAQTAGTAEVNDGRMSDIRTMLVDSATRLFADHVNAKMLDAAKHDGWSSALWKIVEDAQLPLVSIAEDAGGAGGSLSDFAAVLRIAGRCTAPIPLAETALAGWLLASSRLAIPAGPLTVAPVHGEEISARKVGRHWKLSGSLQRVPFARIAGHIVVLAAGPDWRSRGMRRRRAMRNHARTQSRVRTSRRRRAR